MSGIKFFTGDSLPLEMHKVRIIQKLTLPPIEKRLKCITEAGNNTFLLKNRDVFLDMLTDSGVNAMSDNQLSAMMHADDSYAGSETFTRLESKVKEIFDTDYFLPAHQGRACENILAKTFVKPGSVALMNYHFTTAKAHITQYGGSVIELVSEDGLKTTSSLPFKGNVDLEKLKETIKTHTPEQIAFMRIEAGTNLIGGQPLSLKNIKDTCKICKDMGVLSILDASLLADNLHFIKNREDVCKYMSIREITREIADQFDIIYFSGRKLGFGRGGGICTKSRELYVKMRELVTLFEGFLTYGGMSVREMEAITVGLEETMDEEMINQGPMFIEFMVNELLKHDIPVVTPAGGLGCHLNAREFLPHVAQTEFPSGALASALYISSGVRGMERGTLSEDRNPDGSEHLADMELLRLALPRRVFTLSQVKYAVDRICWLYKNRDIVGGLRFEEEPKILRFFFGRLVPVSDWQDKLVAKFREDFGDSL